jgi:hypothetical protein
MIITLVGRRLYTIDELMALAGAPEARRGDLLVGFRNAATGKQIVQHAADIFGVSTNTTFRIR